MYYLLDKNDLLKFLKNIIFVLWGYYFLIDYWVNFVDDSLLIDFFQNKEFFEMIKVFQYKKNIVQVYIYI